MDISRDFILLKKIIAWAREAVILINHNGRIIIWNEAAEAIFGYHGSEAIGKDVHELLAPVCYRDTIRAAFEVFRQTGSGPIIGTTRELTAKRKDGSEFPIELSVSAFDINGKWHAASIIRDISERKRVEQSLREIESKFRNLVEQSLVGVYLIQDGRFVYVNPRLAEIFGYAQAEMIGSMGNLDVTASEDRRLVAENIRKRMNAEVCGIHYAFRGVKKDGTQIDVEVYGSRTEFNGKPAVIGTLLDITERQRAEEQIDHLAHYDALTGLPNRMLLRDRLHQAILDARRRDTMVGVLQVDLDRFKYINDTMGHQVGDVLLETVAERIHSCVRRGDMVARQGGDEFSIILEDLSQARDAALVAGKILAALSEPVRIEEQDFVVTASIGISLYPYDGADAQSLLMSSETAMYYAKNEGRNNSQFFAAEMNVMSKERLSLEKDLRQALEKQEFLLYYQPQVDFESRRIIGVEALIRWGHPELGMVSPAKFIPLAEETGLIIPIGEWVLRTACAQTRAWHDAGFCHLQVSVNLSARQFKQQNLSRTVREIIGGTGLAPECLELELTESTLVQNPERVITTLQELKAMGVQFSVDDFGTGYSSLSYLKRFPLDKLKIDQSFVRDITTDPSDAAITRAVIALGRSLGLRVIAEGVETPEQLKFLCRNQCHGMQGYYFSRPLPAEQFSELLAEGRSLELPGDLC